MRRLIRTHGPCTLAVEPTRTPFESLVRAVAHQQLNGTAAETILRRFRALFAGRRFPSAKELASVNDDASRAIRAMPDAEIIERLVQVRGVGRWTVEMLLIFKLGRPDVFPADDFGVRKGARLALGLPKLP